MSHPTPTPCRYCSGTSDDHDLICPAVYGQATPTPTPTDDAYVALVRRARAASSARLALTRLGAVTWTLPAGHRSELGPEDAPVWSITTNTPGYLPMADEPYFVIGEEAAREAYLETLEREADALAERFAAELEAETDTGAREDIAQAIAELEGTVGAVRQELATMPAGYLSSIGGWGCHLEDGSLGINVSMTRLEGDDAREARRAAREEL